MQNKIQKSKSYIFRKRYLPILIILALIGTFSIFLFWLLTVVAPVASVEAQYQTRKALVAAFGSDDIRRILLPSFRISVREQSKHEQGGIVIPSLFLDEPIVFNVDPNNSDIYTQALKQGIAHASSTRLPDTGGIGYYFAHSSSPSVVRQYNAVFYLLGKLQNGERIIVWYEGTAHKYKVSEKLVTVPEDVSFLDQTKYKKETIVLQTCWPPGTTQRRLLVFAERDETSL